MTNLILFVAILLFVYTLYKYLFYSGECNPMNGMSVEMNSLFNLVGLGTDFIFWLIPVMVFFWPTAALKHEERQYRRVHNRWSTTSTTSTNIQRADSDDSDSSEYDDNEF